jgi:hypothetical protein
LRGTSRPHYPRMSLRKTCISWEPVTESNRRPSPTMGFRSVSWPGILSEGQIRGALLQLGWDRFGKVRAGCGLPDSSQPGHGGGAHVRPRFHQARSLFDRCGRPAGENAGAVRGARSADDHPLPAMTGTCPWRAASTAPSASPPQRPCWPWRPSRPMFPTGTPRGRLRPRRDRDHRPAGAGHNRRLGLCEFDGDA